MRLGKYKAHFRTFGTKPCRRADGTHRPHNLTAVVHSPPLVFDLHEDPAESTPIVVPDALMLRILDAHRSFWADVNATMRSSASFDADSELRPCSNEASACCRMG